VSGRVLKQSQQTNPVPAEEKTCQSTNRLILDGDKVRYENNHPLSDWPTSRVPYKSQIGVFDGLTSVLFRPQGHFGEGPTGFVENAPNSSVVAGGDELF